MLKHNAKGNHPTKVAFSKRTRFLRLEIVIDRNVHVQVHELIPSTLKFAQSLSVLLTCVTQIS